MKCVLFNASNTFVGGDVGEENEGGQEMHSYHLAFTFTYEILQAFAYSQTWLQSGCGAILPVSVTNLQ